MNGEARPGNRPWIIGLVVLMVLVQLADPRPLGTLRDAGFDLHQRLHPAAQTALPVVILDIDERSLAAFGQWPWPRDLLARLTAAAHAAGAQAVGLDILLPEPDRASPRQILAQWRRAPPPGLDTGLLRHLTAAGDTDAELAATLAATPSVLARTLTQGHDGPQRLVRNLPALEAAATGAGLVTLTPDPDGVYRSVRLVQTVGGEEQTAFALALLRVATLPPGPITVQPTRNGLLIMAGGRSIPTDRQGRIWLRVLADTRFMRVSAADLLSGATPDLRGRIVVVGSSAAGLISPFRVATGAALSPADLQAQIVGNLVSDAALVRPDWARPLELGWALLCCLVLLRAEQRGRMARLLATFAGLAVVTVACVHASFTWARILLDATTPLLFSALLALALLGANFAQAQRLRREAQREHDMALALVGLARQARSSFLANLSHEFRTPLNIVIGGAEIITNEALGPIAPQRYRDYGRAILDGGLALLSLVNRTITLASAEAARVAPADDLVNVRAAVETAITRNFTPEDRPHWRIELVKPQTWPNLLADPQMLGAMLDCLLSNARKFAATTPKLEIACTQNVHREVVLSIGDHGPGMDGAQVAAIMAPFQRLDFHASAVLQGVGFGLPLTRAMVQLHGGRLEIASKPGGGTLVLLAFPQWRARQNSATNL